MVGEDEIKKFDSSRMQILGTLYLQGFCSLSKLHFEFQILTYL